RHLRNVYRLLQKPVPDELFVTNISRAPALGSELEPTRLLERRIDGEESSYFEWLPARRSADGYPITLCGLAAAHLEIRPVAGAMHQSEPRPSVLTDLWVGFDGA